MGILFRYVATNTATTGRERFGKSRQSLSPEFSLDPAKQRFSFMFSTPSVTMPNGLSASPDGRKACFVTGTGSSSGIDQFVFFDPEDLAGTATQPSAMTGSRVEACAVSDLLAAVGGLTAVLHVYSFDEGTVSGLISYVSGVSSTGLGAIRSLVFSKDQRYLYVAHNTTPFLRRYDTSDWSFVNASTAFATAITALGVLDSGHVVACRNSSPYMAVYSSDLQQRHAAITTSGYQRSENTVIVQDARNPHACYIPLAPGDASTNRVKMAKVTVAPGTNAVTFESKTEQFELGDDSSSGLINWMYYDEIADKYFVLYYGVNSASTADLRSVKVIDPDTLENDVQWSKRYTEAIALESTAPEMALYVPALRYYRIAGTVRDIDNVPAQRIVRAYRRSDGELMAETISNPATGNYTIELSGDGVYDVQFLTLDGETLNDLFYSKATPELVEL